ncbi:hypothetical protein BGX30_001822 [Mortierella sp. GBA39]|nr:hypothetical protein BGX30_001822 [Mortierella sp. GBA39]
MSQNQNNSDDAYDGRLEDPTEESPLLQSAPKPDSRPATALINQGSWRRMAGVFLLMTVSYLVIGAIVSYKRLSLPAPMSVADAVGPNDFSAEWAWQHLEQIAQKPHPINSRENVRIREYLVQTVKGLQKAAQLLNQTIELGVDDVHLTQTKNYLGNVSRLEYYESSNVLVRVVGTEGRAEGSLKGYPEAVVVDAHYDSVLIGHGATDDGIGVSVCLEMIRNLINHPVKHNVIFNINNGEEVGLYGAAAFMKHPWSKDVKAFVNLEGAGAGGRALLFRASNQALAQAYSKGGNSPHANVFGNDIFKLGLIKSGTDFSVYTGSNIPGVDIAFYSRRAFYHTLQDDIEHTSKGSVQHMGITGLNTVRNIADSDYLIKPKKIVSSEASIYYDIAGFFMLTYSFNTYLTLNYNLLIIAPIFVAWTIISSAKHGLTLGVVLRSYLSLIISFVAAIISSVIFAKILDRINPMLVYGEHWLGFMFFFFQCSNTIICVQWAWVRLELWLRGDSFGPLEVALERIRVDSEQVSNVGMVLFWWTLLIGATVIGRSQEIGLFYFISWFTVTSMISAYFAVYPRRRGTPWTLARLWINFVPLMMVLDVAITNMIAMGQTLVDGTPSFAIMALFSLCALNCVMPLVPTIHRSANFRKMGQVSVFFSVALLISCCIVFPYSAQEAPNKLVWRQVYDLNKDTSYVTVKTVNNLETILDMVPAAKKRKCSPDPVSNGALTQCVYFGATPKLVVESKKAGFEIIKSTVSAPEHRNGVTGEAQIEAKHLLRKVHVKWTALDSRLCAIQFPSNSSLVSLKLAGFDDPDEGYHTPQVDAAIRLGMTAFKRDYDQEYDLEVEYEVENKDSPALEGTLACLYDEWDNEQIPAFTDMKNHLPQWALLGGGKGPGLLTIQKHIHV